MLVTLFLMSQTTTHSHLSLLISLLKHTRSLPQMPQTRLCFRPKRSAAFLPWRMLIQVIILIQLRRSAKAVLALLDSRVASGIRAKTLKTGKFSWKILHSKRPEIICLTFISTRVSWLVILLTWWISWTCWILLLPKTIKLFYPDWCTTSRTWSSWITNKRCLEITSGQGDLWMVASSSLKEIICRLFIPNRGLNRLFFIHLVNFTIVSMCWSKILAG